jgi:hypothetical protein
MVPMAEAGLEEVAVDLVAEVTLPVVEAAAIPVAVVEEDKLHLYKSIAITTFKTDKK